MCCLFVVFVVCFCVLCGCVILNVFSGVCYGLVWVLFKVGVCLCSEVVCWIVEGCVCVFGCIVCDFEFLIGQFVLLIEVDGWLMDVLQCLYLMFNKLCGVVIMVQDECGCDIVYCCFDGVGLLWIVLVGCLDKVSEGLLLFSNDLQWVVYLIDLEIGLQKIYYVQVDCLFDDVILVVLQIGVEDEGDFFVVCVVCVLCSGDKIVWLEVVFDEGCNCYICCLLVVFDLQVLCLVWVVIGGLLFGDFGKGQWWVLQVSDQQWLGVVVLG